MRYLGGKSKLGARIGAIIDQVLEDTGTSVVWEPFVGGNNLSRHVKRATAYVCSDANEALITMWNAVKQGWIPPDAVTEDEYMERKRSNRDPHDPLTAFMGFGCSFGGGWWKGYAKNGHKHNYVRAAKNSILKKRTSDLEFVYGSYDRLPPPADACVIYCDPPYVGTTGYGDVGAFDTDAFWGWCRKMSAQGHYVLVSEYRAPADVMCVAEWTGKTLMHGVGRTDGRIERLFMAG